MLIAKPTTVRRTRTDFVFHDVGASDIAAPRSGEVQMMRSRIVHAFS
jgi:hypothetical protein